jgi:hypothetical protein
MYDIEAKIRQMSGKEEQAVSSEPKEDDHDSRSQEEEEEEETAEATGTKKDKAASARHEKRMKRALQSLGTLQGSTYSNADVASTIMVAQNKVFGTLKLEEFGPEEKNRSRTHVNPLSIQFLQVSWSVRNSSCSALMKKN